MHSLFPVLFASFWILVLGIVDFLFLRLLNKVWWKKRWVKICAVIAPIFGLLAVVAWGFGVYRGVEWLAMAGGTALALVFVTEVCLLLTLPISGILHGVDHLLHRHAERTQPEPKSSADPKRRLFLKTAAATLPVASLAMGVTGVGRAIGSISIPRRTMAIPGLPPALDGLRILQISDTHLWHYVTLDDLTDLCTRAADLKPDLVLVTGDVADNLALLPDALDTIAQLKPPLGAFATLGNHEYFRGVEEVRRLFDRSPIPLFVDTGTMISSGERSFFLAGIDDPRRLSQAAPDFFPRTIDKSLQGRPDGAFTILMSHRPDALDYAATKQIGLTLAGHTHGGQVGLFGRSVFEPAFPQKYLWGTYRKDQSLLYTSSGAGHWFPFRLGCPPEAPLLELRRA